MAVRDLPSTVLLWVLAAGGVGVAVLAAQLCHSKSYQAAACLTISAICTVQLLGFCVTCFTYRFWVVQDVSSARKGPSQDEDKPRRGFPSLKSNKASACGLDLWSLVVVVVLILPIAVPLLSFYQPSERYTWKSSVESAIGTTRRGDSTGARYTTGAYEAITLATESSVQTSGRVLMHDTADVKLLPEEDSVVVPSRVSQSCRYEEVRAKGISAIVGKYECTWSPTTNNVSGKDMVNVNVTKPRGDRTDLQAVQVVTAVHSDATVVCTVKYFLATADVTWKGTSDGVTRNCRIASFRMASDPQPFYKSIGLRESMEDLSLPLRNAFQAVVVHERIASANPSDRLDFYGAISAAATIIRSIDIRNDPGDSRVSAEAGTSGISVQYTTGACIRYGWSGLVIALVALNLLLAAFGTLLCVSSVGSGPHQQQGSWMAEMCGLEAGGCCGGKASSANESTTNSLATPFSLSSSMPVRSPPGQGSGTGLSQYSGLGLGSMRAQDLSGSTQVMAVDGSITQQGNGQQGLGRGLGLGVRPLGSGVNGPAQ